MKLELPRWIGVSNSNTICPKEDSNIRRQEPESDVDKNVLSGARYSDQRGSYTASHVGSQISIDNFDVTMDETETLIADPSISSQANERESVASTPIYRTQAHEPPSPNFAMSLRNEPMGLDMKCDVCFGVVG